MYVTPTYMKGDTKEFKQHEKKEKKNTHIQMRKSENWLFSQKKKSPNRNK